MRRGRKFYFNNRICIFLCIIISFYSNLFGSPIDFNPIKKEGYFQGWNYYFLSDDKNTIIFVTFLVSNLGPGSLNNGTSVYINNPYTGIIYKTNEYSYKELYAKPEEFGQKSRDSFMERRGNIYKVHIMTEELDLEMTYYPTTNQPILLSNGEHQLTNYNGFLRADIGFPKNIAKVRFNFNGRDLVFHGMGGMEHLKTDVEVYYYSSQWEILRAYNSSGDGILFGGYKGLYDSSNNNPPSNNGFQRVVSLSPNKTVNWHDEVERIEILQKKLNKLSGYEIPTIQEVYLKKRKDCKLRITNIKLIGEINVLSNISAVLKYLIQLFFAKPYHIHFDTDVELICNKKSTVQLTGVHSYYLINPVK